MFTEKTMNHSFKIFLLGFLVLVGCGEKYDSRDLDGDISSVERDLASAKVIAESYGGMVGTLASVRVNVLENSLAMLKQRKGSLFYFIPIRYEFAGAEVCSSITANTDELSADIASAESELAAAKAESDRYSGGLIHSLALARVATHEFTVASLKQRQLFAKWDVPLPVPGSAAEGDVGSEPASPVVSDSEAL